MTLKSASLTGSSLPNNDGGRLMSSSSSAMKHDDYMQIQNAIMEFYASCHRDLPIGEVWIVILTKRHSTPNRATRGSTIHWKKVFRLMDHRRLITFGVIHGYIRRVHNYPLLANRNISMDDDPSTPKYSNIPLPKSALSHDRISRGSSHSTYSHHIKNEQAMRRTQSKQKAAALMDGMHCDDEIVCSVELPFDEILTMFPKDSVVSVFARS